MAVAVVWLDGAVREADGNFSFTLHSPTGKVYEVLATTNVGLPMSQWTLIGTLTNESGTVQWTDPATNLPRRFYRMRVLEP